MLLKYFFVLFTLFSAEDHINRWFMHATVFMLNLHAMTENSKIFGRSIENQSTRTFSSKCWEENIFIECNKTHSWGEKKRRNSNSSSGKNNNKIAVCVSFLSAFLFPPAYILRQKTIVTRQLSFENVITLFQYVQSGIIGVLRLCVDLPIGSAAVLWRENNNNTFNLLSDLTLLMKRLSGKSAREIINCTYMKQIIL
jgi:hypothetical protein